MWPETVAATGMLTSRWPLAALGRLARFIYRRADAIIVISPGFRRNLLAKGVPADKIHVIPNWADEDIYRPLPADPRLAEENGMAGRFNVVFAGNLGAAQALENVLNAAQRLRDLSSVQFVFIGSGVEEEALHRRAAALRLDNVRFLGRMPADRMPHFLALADVLLVHLRRDPLFEITIPSKTISYLAVGRPILSATAGDAAEVIEQAGAGLVCPPEDAEALETCVRKLFALPPASRDGMGRRGRAAFEQNYTRRVLIPRYEQLFAAMIERRHHREADRTEASGKAQA
jgi:glycosyltransferase involved in cell wall biosynthesis